MPCFSISDLNIDYIYWLSSFRVAHQHSINICVSYFVVISCLNICDYVIYNIYNNNSPTFCRIFFLIYRILHYSTFGVWTLSARSPWLTRGWPGNFFSYTYDTCSCVFDDDGDQMPSRSSNVAGLSGLSSDLPVPRAIRRSGLQRIPRLALRSSVHGHHSKRYIFIYILYYYVKERKLFFLLRYFATPIRLTWAQMRSYHVSKYII